MKTLKTLLFSVLAVIGGMIGGAVFQPIPAHAQQNLRSENQILVPVDGLRFVTETGRTIAIMGIRNGNGALVMFDANGRPSVTLSAHTGGTVSLFATPDGGQIEVSNLDNSSRGRLSASASGVTFDSIVSSSLLSFGNTASGGSLLIPGRNGAKGVELLSGINGGQVNVYGSGGKPALTTEGTANGGMLSVRDGTGKTTATVSNAGIFASLKDSRVVWQGPPVKN